jgi:hypothetical protein
MSEASAVLVVNMIAVTAVAFPFLQGYREDHGRREGVEDDGPCQRLQHQSPGRVRGVQ